MALKTKTLRVEKGIIEKRKINEIEEESVKQSSLKNFFKAAVQTLYGKNKVFKIEDLDFMVFIFTCLNLEPFNSVEAPSNVFCITTN
ncbi:MAG: hypothetical protein PVJ06_02895 [Desulfobacterales bacterium]|jgi:hypothetical protein